MDIFDYKRRKSVNDLIIVNVSTETHFLSVLKLYCTVPLKRSMRPIATDGVAWFMCLPVCLSVCWAHR